MAKKQKIYESPDKGKTVYVRYFGSIERILYKKSYDVNEVQKYYGHEKIYIKEIINILI